MPVFRITSGARYSGVPHSVYVSPARVSAIPRQTEQPTILYFLCEAKVDQLKVPLGVNEYVLGLEVAVGDALALVQKLQDQDNLGGVELRGGLVEAACAAEIAEDFAAGAVVELCMLPAGHGVVRARRTTM